MHSEDLEASLVAKVLASFAERFGIDPRAFKSYRLYARKEDVWCTTPEAADTSLPQIVRRGLRIARVFEHSVRPTTNAVQLFGHLVTRNRIELDERETNRFLAGLTQDVKVISDVTDGFVVAFHRDFALGIGLLKGSKLKSQVPRSRRVLG